MAIVTTDNQHYTDIAAAIRSKNGTETLYKPSEMAAAIQAISGGGEPVIEPLEITSNGTYIASEGVDGYSPVTVNVSGEPFSLLNPKEVNFYDYEGTLLYAYTLEEAKGLSELPPAPQHEGLLFQEWNWTLEDIKALTISMNVGATYITDNGKTRLYITIPANAIPDRPPPRNQVPLYIRQSVENGVTIDWGDGTAPESLMGIGDVTITHTYSQSGDYVISLDTTSDCILELGNSANNYGVVGNITNNGRAYFDMLYKVHIGKNVQTIGKSVFSYYYSLTTVTIPKGVISIDKSAFYGCYPLFSIIVPDSVVNIEANAFRDCYSLTFLSLPNSITNIGNNALDSCYSLMQITIPNSIQTIGDSAFSNCHSMRLARIANDSIIVGESIFQNCYTLMSAIIPNNIMTVKEFMFNYCYSLGTLIIPESVTSIGRYAFSGCQSLSSIMIPSGVTNIDSSAFANCLGVKEYHFLSTAPPTLGDTYVFYGIPSDCTIYVPKGSAEAYKTATNWTTYSQYIQEEPA